MQAAKLGLLTPGFNLLADLEKFLEAKLPEDAHRIATDRLHISMTDRQTNKNLIVSSFDSKEHVIKVGVVSFSEIC